ncbi:MAG: HAD-superfamily hydrolase, subfamily IA, variant 1 [Microgenomates group bacterium GW2011_GWA2_40_6]|nr:MAG: HAD-superfamily hydrolase, subfamily IA, variant 1 [Microgenomates group bacterium GW2011_GWA2_40_6]
MKCLIFDFDGTIVDNLPQVLNLLTENLNRKNIDISKYSLEYLRQTGVKKFMKQIKISKLELFSIYLDIKKKIHQNFNENPPVKGLSAVLPELEKKYMLIVFSSNKSENIFSYLKKYHLEKYFSEIAEDSSYFGKHIGLNKIVKKHNFNKQEVLYLGDETRDIEAARKTGIKSGAVLWGFEGSVPLTAAKPNYLFTKPLDLLKIS